MRVAANWPSMRGAWNALSSTPSKVPAPPISTARVGEPNAVMIPASSRSLSCHSELVTWNGMTDRSPYAVRPWNSTKVVSVAMRLGATSTHSGPNW